MRPCCTAASHITAILLVAAGIFILSWLPAFVHQQVKERISLEGGGTQLYSHFVNQSEHIQIYKVFKFFNVTNRPEVVHNGAIPVVEEKGPYYYQRIRIRNESTIRWHPNGTMTYSWHEYYRFSTELSQGAETDMITTARLGVLFAFQTTAATDFAFFEKLVFDLVTMNVQDTFVEKSVGDLLRGYYEPFLHNLTQSPWVAISPDMPMQAPSAIYSGAHASKTQEKKSPVPERPLCKFTMWRGHVDLSEYWTTPETQVLRGTDGACYAPFLHDVDIVTAFVEPLKRPVDLTYVGDFVANGIPTRRYQPRFDAFFDRTRNPLNKGFGIFKNGFQPRPPVRDIPDDNIYGCITKQHYLDCDTTDCKVEMAPPDAARDETHLEFEPYTGTLVRLRKRSQLVALMKPMTFFDFKTLRRATVPGTEYLNKTWMPVMMETEQMDLQGSLRDQLHDEIVLPMKLYVPIGSVLIVLGVLVEGVVIYYQFCKKRNRADDYRKTE